MPSFTPPTYNGPIFHAETEIDGMIHQINADAAQRGYDLVQGNLASSLQYPTGRYQSTIHVRHDGIDAEVTDGGTLPYGFWLEGTGTRNYPVTRFRGYKSFERAYVELETQIDSIIDPIVDAFVTRMNA